MATLRQCTTCVKVNRKRRLITKRKYNMRCKSRSKSIRAACIVKIAPVGYGVRFDLATEINWLWNLLTSTNINVKVKTRLYEAIILSTLLYGADVWPLTATLTKSLDAGHHRWQRSILGISWKDRITNVEVRARTGQQTMDNILRERRLRWLGHVFRMDHKRIPQQALYCQWQVPGYKRGPGRPRANWRGAVSKDLRKMGFTWEEAEVADLDRHGWRRSVAQCVQLDTG